MRKRNGVVFLLAGMIALSSSGCHVIAAYVGDSINVSEFTDRSGQKETEGPEESIEEEESTEPEETTEEEESSEIPAESQNSNAYTEEEIYEKLVKHYAWGSEDEGLAVMPGTVNGSIYSTVVRCGVPGNTGASQTLYEINADMLTGEVTQIRVLTDNQVKTFNLHYDFSKLLNKVYEYDDGSLVYSLEFTEKNGQVTANMVTFSSSGTGTGGEYFEQPVNNEEITYHNVDIQVAGIGVVAENSEVTIIPQEDSVFVHWKDENGVLIFEADLPYVRESRATENEQQENDQESEAGENLTVDVETQVQEVRDIYWEIQNNLEALQQEDGGAVVRYLDSDGHIRKIVAPKGAYYDEEISEKYNAEYYYEIDQNQYYLRFMFIYGNGEEYRFYFDRNRDCFRYIGADGIVHDYQPPLEALEDITDLYPFSMYGQLEIAWAMGG